MPDDFVPLDTISYTKYHRELVAKGVVNQANLYFIDHYREQWQKEYPTFAKFDKKFTVTDDMLALLLQKAEEAKVPYDEEQYQASLPLLRTQLKALIARDLWDMTEYFRVINTTNESVKAALKWLKDN